MVCSRLHYSRVGWPAQSRFLKNTGSAWLMLFKNPNITS